MYKNKTCHRLVVYKQAYDISQEDRSVHSRISDHPTPPSSISQKRKYSYPYT